MSVLDRKIGEIVDENFIYGRALNYLGVDFYQYRDERLAALCKEKGIARDRLVQSFYQFDSNTRIPFREIKAYPLGLTLEYLRYAHHTYIKHHLPYIAGLITKLDSDIECVRDLKEIFPYFVEDFIRHIYEEEDELFRYVNWLLSLGGNKINEFCYQRHMLSLIELSDHHVDEDEMAGLRELVAAIPAGDLLTSVIVKEIQAFDREILYHAAIENDILFPGAIALERDIRQRVKLLSTLN